MIREKFVHHSYLFRSRTLKNDFEQDISLIRKFATGISLKTKLNYIVPSFVCNQTHVSESCIKNFTALT